VLSLWTFSLCVHYKTKTNKVRGFTNNIFYCIIKILWDQNFLKFLSAINLPCLGSCEVPQKFRAKLVQPFWSLLVANKQATGNQSKYTWRNWVFVTNRLSLEPNVVDHRYFKLWILLVQIIKVWYFKGLHFQVAQK